MSEEQERSLERQRADARERVRRAQEREAREGAERQHPVAERAKERMRAGGVQADARTEAARDDVEDDEAPDV